MENTNIEKLATLLKAKGNLKQEVYQSTLEVFEEFKDVLAEYNTFLSEQAKDELYEVEYKENGKFEVRLKFAGDLLIFNMHTNVFSFDESYAINQSAYVKEDESRKYVGMIEVYNYLADSFKYSRMTDVGYLVARVFVNNEKHFFVEGKDQLGFLYKDFDNLIINKDFIKLIVEQTMFYCIGFDLWVPKFQDISVLTVGQKTMSGGTISHKTGKRLGFDLSNMSEVGIE